MWGEQGHIRLLRFDDGPGPTPAFCGTDYHPEEGVACQGTFQAVEGPLGDELLRVVGVLRSCY